MSGEGQGRCQACVVVPSRANPLAHMPGGELSGSIDECVPHAVTKLSHVGSPATELGATRIIATDEDPEFVLNVGCRRGTELDHAVLTPHRAANTHGVSTATGAITVNIVLMAIADARRPQLLNPEPWEIRHR